MTSYYIWRQIKQRGDMRTSSFNNAFVSKINTEDHTHHTETTRLAVERFLHVKALTAPIGLSGRRKTPGKDWKVYVKHAELNKNISHHNLVTLLMSVLDWKQPYTRYRCDLVSRTLYIISFQSQYLEQIRSPLIRIKPERIQLKETYWLWSVPASNDAQRVRQSISALRWSSKKRKRTKRKEKSPINVTFEPQTTQKTFVRITAIRRRKTSWHSSLKRRRKGLFTSFS